tara:strand:- start:12375 stop:13697 length:1323 start_codon:yes stop_codon:yes gene_type:complete
MKILLFLSLLIFKTCLGQTPCATDEYNKPFIEQNPQKYAEIEKDIQRYLKAPRVKSDGTYVIPIVVHVVYNDWRENLHDSIIYQQLKVLNDRFNLRNADTVLLTDTLQNWKGNFKISFELAHLDPEGYPTTGITRTHTNVGEFSYYSNNVKKSSQGKAGWPNNRYLNIWICDLYDGLMGYAQFPGGEDWSDGVVVDWQSVGDRVYSWTYPMFHSWAKGHVLVHEIGHWLNLHHPWGDWGPCGDDYIPETGLQDGPIYPSAQCPDTLFSQCDTPERVFVKHYMDYVGADCMCTFTKNQVARGIASLENSRVELLNSYVPKPILTGFENTKVRPTFTKGRIILEFPQYEGTLKIAIYDMLGREIHMRQTTFPFIDIKLNIPNGSYIIDVLKKDKRVFQQKIIINSGSPYGANLNYLNLKTKAGVANSLLSNPITIIGPKTLR